jgi:light-regulated signal transduction histidine kinase (bacteriophytochrome)
VNGFWTELTHNLNKIAANFPDEKEKEYREFLFICSHKICMPMNGILGFANLLCEAESEEVNVASEFAFILPDIFENKKPLSYD